MVFTSAACAAEDRLVVCAYVDDELRDTFDGVVPVKLSAEEVAFVPEV